MSMSVERGGFFFPVGFVSGGIRWLWCAGSWSNMLMGALEELLSVEMSGGC